MLLTVSTLRERVQNSCDSLILDLQDLTGRYGKAEADAWAQSLVKLNSVFAAPSFQPLHLYFGSRGNLALEYQLPSSASWCDVVMLGKHESRAAAVILELKDWATAGSRPGRAPGLVEHQGAQKLHPSEQVRGYVEYCRKYHSTVEDANAQVHGCVLFTRDPYTSAFTNAPNHQLVADFPVFTMAPDDVELHFPEYFATRLSQPDEAFAEAFERGRYRQKRGFVAQIGKQILEPESSPFELLDGQRLAFALSWAIVEESFLTRAQTEPKRRVVIIQGPPGSGKSVIAARLWASLVTDKRLPEGDVVFTSTSMSQNSNWSHLFEYSSGEKGARGIVRKATGYTPIQTGDLGKLRKQHGKLFLKNAETWRQNLQVVRDLGETFRSGSEDFCNLISIVDEAHALINPEQPEGRGQFGFVVTLGPQAYHIIRTSQLSVFLLDPEQGFRLRENTTVEDIYTWSRELGAGEPELISLEGAQFRCAGSAEYVQWLESVLDGAPASRNSVLARAWYRVAALPSNGYRSPTGGASVAAESAAVYDVIPGGGTLPANTEQFAPSFDFRLFDNPATLEDALRERYGNGDKVRLLSTYSRPWKTVQAANPHDLPPNMQDFHEPYVADGRKKYWSRVWNFVPYGSDYSWFIIGQPGSVIYQDPLAEVGCTYAVRGFDYDYVGVLWLDDLIWRSGEWKINPGAIHESGVAPLPKRAEREIGLLVEKPATQELIRRIAQSYRILLTRALKGAYLWVPDDETREFLSASMRAPENTNETIAVESLRRLPLNEIVPFKNCVPLYDLKIAAGAFSGEQHSEDVPLGQEDKRPEAYEWVQLPDGHRPSRGLFVAQVVGESMNRRIPNRAWCLFRVASPGSRQGKVVLAEHREIQDAETGGHYTVKVYNSRKVSTSDGSWQHSQITLTPDTTADGYEQIVITPEFADELRIVAEFVAVLG